MKAINTMKMTLQSLSINESYARLAVSGFIAQTDPNIDEISDIKTAVSEAFTNSVVHAYKESLGNIYIKVVIYDNDMVGINIKDKGVGIDNIEKAMEPMYTTDAENERAGLGFAVMQTFMDNVKVKSKKGFGTSVTLIKKIKKKIRITNAR